jgi:hypothetical protein
MEDSIYWENKIFSFSYTGWRRTIEIKMFDDIVEENNNYLTELLKDSFKQNKFKRKYQYHPITDMDDKKVAVYKETIFSKKVVINKKIVFIDFMFIRIPGFKGCINLSIDDIQFILNLIKTECYKEPEFESFQVDKYGNIKCRKFNSIVEKDLKHQLIYDCCICKNFPDCTMTVIKNLTLKELQCPKCHRSYIRYHILVYKATFRKANPTIELRIPCCSCFDRYKRYRYTI